mgnify:CR=1 FL=1
MLRTIFYFLLILEKLNKKLESEKSKQYDEFKNESIESAKDDEFLVIASNSVWDYISEKDMYTIISTEENDLKKISSNIIDFCFIVLLLIDSNKLNSFELIKSIKINKFSSCICIIYQMILFLFLFLKKYL